jgi:hypothetical protein
MKSISVLGAMIAGAVFLTHGQGAAQPPVDLQIKQNQSNPPAVTPSGSPEIPDVSQLDEIFKQTSMGKAADEFRRHVEWRRLQNEVANDPAVVTAKKAAEAARTDLEKRRRLSDYYNVYYKRMEALAETPDMKAALDALKAGHLAWLAQPRVRPTPTPSPTATPPPTAPPVHIEPPLPVAAPSPSPATAGPAPNPAILPTPSPSPNAVPSPRTSPSPTAAGTP